MKNYMVLNCGMFILTLVGVILFAISFQSVPENHVAIRQHKFNKKLIDNELYGSGRFLIGLVHKLRIYPLAYQQIRFSNDSNNAPISSITKDSAKIQISSQSIRWRLACLLGTSAPSSSSCLCRASRPRCVFVACA